MSIYSCRKASVKGALSGLFLVVVGLALVAVNYNMIEGVAKELVKIYLPILLVGWGFVTIISKYADLKGKKERITGNRFDVEKNREQHLAKLAELHGMW
ncbi:MAG: hypothetical protein ACLKAK_01100 [Alkaliphilus sp.]